MTVPRPEDLVPGHAPTVPVVAAPMAGGPSTAALAAAVSAAGGIGFLAGGMRAPAALVEDVAAVRRALAGTGAAGGNGSGVVAGAGAGAAGGTGAASGTGATGGTFGVNLFVPEPANTAIPAERREPGSEARRRRADSVRRYRAGLLAEARRLGVDLPEAETLDPDAMDGWEDKLDAAEAGAWPLVTFTFGLPGPEVFERLHAAGCVLGVTVTSAAEAVRSVAHGADLLSVQGPESGGHRSVHDPAADPGTTPLPALLAEVRAAVGPAVPLLAAGGIMDAAGVREVLAAGAAAAQCGTAFLRAEEAGTSALQRSALESAAAGAGFAHHDGSARTALTRAYSGRWARGLENRFLREHADAPAAYPEVNALTGPLRRAAVAAGDAESTSLWAGVGASRATAAPAAELLRSLAP